MPASVISDDQLQEALALLSALEPPPLVVRGEHMDNFTSVLFFVDVPCRTEAEAERTYFNQVIQPLGKLIPEAGNSPAWMIIFQDARGYLLTSVTADYAKFAL
jgi:hypothetical protein